MMILLGVYSQNWKYVVIEKNCFERVKCYSEQFYALNKVEYTILFIIST